jgi:ribosomal protein S18 acetylase RimI-like enzyme
MAVERASPEGGSFALRIEPRLDHFTLARRYPNAQGYVAVALDGVTVVGMVFASVAPTRLNGELVPGVYLYNLRVHPAHRRQGVGTALLTHAWERARTAFGAEVAWGAVVRSNEPSLRTFRRAGLTQERQLYARLIAPVFAVGQAPGVSWRAADTGDLPSWIAAVDARYANHQLWRPCGRDDLSAEPIAQGEAAGETLLGLAPDGTIISGATAIALNRLARMRLLGVRRLPRVVNRMLGPVFGLLPVRPLLIRRLLLPADTPGATRALFHHLYRHFFPAALGLVVVLDPLDPAWPTVARLAGTSIGIQIMAGSARRIDTSRPWYLE